MEYQFNISLADGTILTPPNPKGWDGLELVLRKDEGKWVVEFSSTLQFIDPFYSQLRDFIKSEGNVCGVNTLEVLGRCHAAEPFELIVLANWMGKDVEFDCEKCIISLRPSDTGGIQRLSEKENDDYCFSPDLDVLLFEVESCFDFVNQEKPFMLVWDIMQLIASQIGNIPLQSVLLTTPFQEHIVSFTPPALGAGDVLELQIEVNTGDTFTAIVNEAGTEAETGQRIKTLLCQHVSAIDPIDWLSRRIANISVGDTGLTTLTSWNEIVNFGLLLNGVDTGITATEVQAYQYGLKGLAISIEGLRDGGNICVSWQKMMDMLQAFAPFTLRELDGTVFLDPEDIQYEITSPVTSSIQITNYTETISDDWLYGNVSIGQDFNVKNYLDSQSAWVWENPTFEDSVLLTPLVVGAFPGNPIGYNITRLGLAILRGQLHINNNTAVTTGVLRINVGTQQFDLNITVNPNAVTVDDIENIVDGGILPEICYEVGDVITLQLIGIPNATFDTGTSLRNDYTVPPFDAPLYNEDLHDELPLFPLNSYDCTDTKSIRLEEDVYGLTGYGISQQMKGLEEYDDTFFLTFVDPADSTKARKFPICVYAPFDCGQPDCKHLKNYCFYNIPLQKSQVARNYAPIIPQNMGTLAFDVVYTWQIDGCLQPAEVSFNDSEFVRVRTDICEINAKDICLSPKTLRAIMAELATEITTSCDGRTFTAFWESLNFNLLDGVSSGVFQSLE